MSKEQFANAREARQHLSSQGYKAITPGHMEGAICWVKADEDGYYLVAKTTDGARLMHYSGTPDALPAGAIVTSDQDDKRAGEGALKLTHGGDPYDLQATSQHPAPLIGNHEARLELHARRFGKTQDALQRQAHAFTEEFNERNDCAVHAVRLACGVSYEYAHAALEAAGRRYRSATYDHTLVSALSVLGAVVVERHALDGQQSRIAEYVRPVGRYIVRTARHFFAVVDGAVLDIKPRERRALRRMWLVRL